MEFLDKSLSQLFYKIGLAEKCMCDAKIVATPNCFDKILWRWVLWKVIYRCLRNSTFIWQYYALNWTFGWKSDPTFLLKRFSRQTPEWTRNGAWQVGFLFAKARVKRFWWSGGISVLIFTSDARVNQKRGLASWVFVCKSKGQKIWMIWRDFSFEKRPRWSGDVKYENKLLNTSLVQLFYSKDFYVRSTGAVENPTALGGLGWFFCECQLECPVDLASKSMKKNF